MLNIKKTYKSRIFRMSLIIVAALAISAGVKLSALAQENRFFGDYRMYDDRGFPLERDYRDRGRYYDGYNTPPRGIKNGYFVKNIKENPAAYGAKMRYLNDDWGKKYLYWTPNGFNGQKLRPLVISLHGNDEEEEDAFARLYHTVMQYNYALVALKWKSGSKVMTAEEISAFIDGIILELKEKEGLNVEPDRVILHGYERGANMAGFLYYYNPGKYAMAVIDSGPFPEIANASDAGNSSSGNTLSIPANELKKLAGSYIYLYSRHEDEGMYKNLEETRQILIAAGVNAELNYTKGLLPGDFSETLSKSIVGMFDRATAGK